MVNIDMWYEDKIQDTTKIDIIFYDNCGEYRGNIYIDDKIVGDYSTKNSCELEKVFSHLNFRWE